MAESVSARAVATTLASVEADLSVIVQLLRQMASEGYEATPEGLEEIGSMVFASSLRLSSVGAGIVTWIDSVLNLTDASRRFFKTIEDNDAEIREAIDLARQSIALIKPAALPSSQEAFSMLEDCLRIIEVRAQSGVRRDNPASNVIPLFQAKAGGRS
jgi:hypothetical protein